MTALHLPKHLCHLEREREILLSTTCEERFLAFGSKWQSATQSGGNSTAHFRKRCRT